MHCKFTLKHSRFVGDFRCLILTRVNLLFHSIKLINSQNHETDLHSICKKNDRVHDFCSFFLFLTLRFGFTQDFNKKKNDMVFVEMVTINC